MWRARSRKTRDQAEVFLGGGHDVDPAAGGVDCPPCRRLHHLVLRLAMPVGGDHAGVKSVVGAVWMARPIVKLTIGDAITLASEAAGLWYSCECGNEVAPVEAQHHMMGESLSASDR